MSCGTCGVKTGQAASSAAGAPAATGIAYHKGDKIREPLSTKVWTVTSDALEGNPCVLVSDEQGNRDVLLVGTDWDGKQYPYLMSAQSA